MKQHITKEQWNELSNKEKDFVRKLIYNKYKNKVELHYNIYVVLNIGEMIEFLGEEHENDLFSVVSELRGSNYDGINDLCDKLWEAVKYKVNNK